MAGARRDNRNGSDGDNTGMKIPALCIGEIPLNNFLILFSRTGQLMLGHQLEPTKTMSKISTPRDLLVEELKDLYSAENQLLKALPKMAEASTNEALKAAFETHLEQTEGHVQRLEQIGEQLGESMKGKKCKAMAGLIAEGKEIIEEDAEPALKDLALIGAAQKVEHYEIAGYGTVRTLAQLAGEAELVSALQQTLDEEGATDKLLTKLASNIDVKSLVEAETE